MLMGRRSLTYVACSQALFLPSAFSSVMTEPVRLTSRLTIGVPGCIQHAHLHWEGAG